MTLYSRHLLPHAFPLLPRRTEDRILSQREGAFLVEGVVMAPDPCPKGDERFDESEVDDRPGLGSLNEEEPGLDEFRLSRVNRGATIPSTPRALVTGWGISREGYVPCLRLFVGGARSVVSSRAPPSPDISGEEGATLMTTIGGTSVVDWSSLGDDGDEGGESLGAGIDVNASILSEGLFSRSNSSAETPLALVPYCSSLIIALSHCRRFRDSQFFPSRLSGVDQPDHFRPC
ncbi:hypothetical protein DL93DRAFT_2079456 [Clavulina sp. PMI_390]|nr:hypothetical protein DL93DRAFT_2079456 [Clavulina sp. PMI_390]